MKISKLFHWLYAFLMFLPIVLFIPNALYYGFNEHATNTETTTINYKYQSNEVNTLDDLVEGNIYHCNRFMPLNGNLLDGQEYTFKILNMNEDPTINLNYQLDEVVLSTFNSNDGSLFFNVYYSGPRYYLTLRYDFNNTYASIDVDTFNEYDLILYDFDFIITENLDLFISEFEFLRSDYPELVFNITSSDFNEIESLTINTDDTISDKMYQAWQSTWDLPLLQWTHTSFVAQPFSYITGLFGVPSDSSLNYVFAYFVSISICWLVFDLVMWLPNLAHRWLDRSSLQ